MSEYHVSFPKLGWSFDIHSTAFSIGSFEVKWYGIIIGFGFLLAFAYGMASCRKMKINAGKLLDAIILGLIFGIIGARLYYVLFFDGDKYIKDPLSILYIHEGGLGIYGGIIGGLLAGGITAKIKKLSVFAALDLASLGFLIGQAVGRWGNFVNQEAFGSETSLPWGMASENTGNVPVHPCFFYEFLWCALGFILLHIFTRKFRRYDGQTFLLYMIWYGVGRFFIEALRTDSLIVPYLNMKVSQLVAVIAVLAGIVLLIVFRKCTKLSGCGAVAIMEKNGITYDNAEESEETKHIWSIFSKKKSEDSQKKKQTGNTEEKTAEALSLKKEDKTEPEPSAKEPTESNKGGE